MGPTRKRKRKQQVLYDVGRQYGLSLHGITRLLIRRIENPPTCCIYPVTVWREGMRPGASNEHPTKDESWSPEIAHSGTKSLVSGVSLGFSPSRLDWGGISLGVTKRFAPTPRQIHNTRLYLVMEVR